MNTVGSLKKVTVSCRAGKMPEMLPEKMDLDIDLPKFEFVFGIAPEGMTPFEYRLVGRHEGETVDIELNKEAFCDFFGPLKTPVQALFHGREGLCLAATITAVRPAENREIIKAMAEMTAHGGSGCDGGDCGCGCG